MARFVLTKLMANPTKQGKAMSSGSQKTIWFWTTLLLSRATIRTVIFSVWELLGYRFFHDLDFRQLHSFYITLGIGSSVVLAAGADWFVLRERNSPLAA